MGDTSTSDEAPGYAGYSRFELELECLANPWYLNHLATNKYLDDPPFVAYLAYLRYFARPSYAKYLSYPEPTLKALELLQHERFRKDVLMPDTVARLIEGGVRASVGEG